MKSLSDIEAQTAEILVQPSTLFLKPGNKCVFTRGLCDGKPVLIVSHPELNKTLYIEGSTLAQINGWIAAFMRIIKE